MTNDREKLARKIAGMGDDRWPFFKYAKHEYLALADFILQREEAIRKEEQSIGYERGYKDGLVDGAMKVTRGF